MGTFRYSVNTVKDDMLLATRRFQTEDAAIAYAVTKNLPLRDFHDYRFPMREIWFRSGIHSEGAKRIVSVTFGSSPKAIDIQADVFPTVVTVTHHSVW